MTDTDTIRQALPHLLASLEPFLGTKVWLSDAYELLTSMVECDRETFDTLVTELHRAGRIELCPEPKTWGRGEPQHGLANRPHHLRRSACFTR